jgi:hypothetical protein
MTVPDPAEAQLMLQLRAPRRRFCPEAHCSVPCGLGLGIECTCQPCSGCAICVPLRRARRRRSAPADDSLAVRLSQPRALFTDRTFTTTKGSR